MSSGRDSEFAAGFLLAAVLSAGCATTRAAEPSARANELERTMIELRAQNAGYVRQIEELQNRNFILEDQVDSLRVADGRVMPSLPPAKRIGAPGREVTSSRVIEEPPGEEDDGLVEYAGEAAQPATRARTRQLLRLAGSGSPRISTVAAAPARDPLGPTEKIADKSADSAVEKLATRGPAPASNEPLRLYRQSLDALHAGHHAAALVGFRKFLSRFPRHDYDDNAQYWIGECYYDLKQYKSAVREFRRVLDRYPRGSKVPDAMLKLGFARLALGDRRDGRQDLESLRRLYPNHAAARLAVARLSQPDDRAPSSTVTLEMIGR